MLSALASASTGLLDDEAARRLRDVGPNRIEEGRGPAWPLLIVRQFQSPLIYILMAAGVVTLLLEEFVDAAVIGAVLVLNAALGFVQEHGAERSMAALRRLAEARARVLRSGRERTINAATLVPGDVVLLQAGDKVPADVRVLHSVELQADESALTGESLPVDKGADPVPRATSLADRTSMCFSGTVVTRGTSRAVVVATGEATELGAIARSVAGVERVATPLQRRIERLALVVTIAVLVSTAFGMVVGLALGEAATPLLLSMVALAVAAIPEGLPIVLTVALAIGVRRMAARRAIVRHLPAVETLGGCTVIGSDKTGTLTENRMTVRALWTDGVRYEVTGPGESVAGGVVAPDGERISGAEGGVRRLLRAGALCNDASVADVAGRIETNGDPTEIALVVSAAKAGIWKEDLQDRAPRIGEIPFDSSRRFAATVHREDTLDRILVKGAPEAVLPMCAMDPHGRPVDGEAVRRAARDLAAEGLRVLAMAEREVPRSGGSGLDLLDPAPSGLVLLGLQAMMDPPREEAVTAVDGCQRAGVRVIMITGDHPATALGIARRMGITADDAGVVTGVEMDGLDDTALRDTVARVGVFARVSPEHKLRIVKALRANGEVVAVTGDGVNDAPALKAADVGAAMGRSGTEAAKEAADIVITNDDFVTVFAAVEEGRVAFDNVRKTTFFLLSTGVAAIIAVLASVLGRFPAPFLPAQMIWLNVVTNGTQDIALAFEPGERDVLERGPRDAREGVLDGTLWQRTVLAGVVMAIGTLSLFLYELHVVDSSLERAQTVALTTMVLFQSFHVGNSRSETRSVFRKNPVSNPLLLAGTAIALGIHAAALYLPFTQTVLRVEPLDAMTWAVMAAVASTVLIAVEVDKLIRRRITRAGRAGTVA